MVGSDNTPSSIECGAPLSPVREVDTLDMTPSSPTPHRHEARDDPSSPPAQTHAATSRNGADPSALPLPSAAPTRSKAGALFHSLTNTGTGRGARITNATTGENATPASLPNGNGNTSLSQSVGSSSNAANTGGASGASGGSWIPGGAGFDRAFKFFMDSDAGAKDDESIWLLGVWHGPKESQTSALPSTIPSGLSDPASKGQKAADVVHVARASSPSSSLSASSPRRTPVDLIHTSLTSSSPACDRAATPAAREERRVGSSISTAASTSDSLRTKSSATSFNVVSQPSALVPSDQPSAFQPDFASRIWCTYRNHFAPIARDGTISEQAASAAESSAAAQLATVQDTSAPSTPSAAPSSSEAARSGSPPASAGRSWLGRKLTESNVGQESAMQTNSQPLGLGAALGAGYANASSTLGDKMGITGLWSRATAAAQAAGFSRAGLTTDSGWGCMLRTGQSLLANALINVHLGRSWLRGAPPMRQAEFLEVLASLSLESSAEKQTLIEFREKRARHSTYVKILSWFLDDPSPACPFGVHRMAREGKRLGKEVGEWFGPSTAAGAIKQLVSEYPDAGLAVELAHDGVFYLDEVRAAAGATLSATLSRQSGKARASTTPGTTGRKGDAVTWRRPVLILIGIRLGLDSVNPIYYESVKATFSFPHSVGIAGGRPSSSYYFMGHQGNSLFYLDPHNVRPAVPLRYPPGTFPAAVPRQLDVAHRFASEDKDDEDEWWSHAYTEAQTSTFHCDKVRRMPIKSLDPSMLLGFLVKDEDDLVDLCARIKALPKAIFSFADSAPKWVDDEDFDPSMESFSEPSLGAESEDEADESKDEEVRTGADGAGVDKQDGLRQKSIQPANSEGAAVPFPTATATATATATITATDARKNDKMFRESQERTAAWLGQGHPTSSSTRSPYANAGSGGGIAFPSLDLLSPQSDAAHTLQRSARMDARQVSTSSAATTRPSRRTPVDKDEVKERDLTVSQSASAVAGNRRRSASRSPAKLGADESFSTMHLSDSEVGSGWEEVSDGGTIAASNSAGVGLARSGSPLRSALVVPTAVGDGGGVQDDVLSVEVGGEGELVSVSLDTPVREASEELRGSEAMPSVGDAPSTVEDDFAGWTSAHKPLTLPRRRSQSKPSPVDQLPAAEVPPVPELAGQKRSELDLDASDDDF